MEVWERPSGKNRLNSTSPELGDIGARVGPGWVVPAAAGCAPWRELGGGGQCGWERTAGSARRPGLTLLLRHFPAPTPHMWTRMGGTLHPQNKRSYSDPGELRAGAGLKGAMLFPSWHLSIRKTYRESAGVNGAPSDKWRPDG